MLVRAEHHQFGIPHEADAGTKLATSQKNSRCLTSNAAFPVDTSATLLSMMRDYEKCKNPINVSFRQLVPWLKVGERATHYIHPYPAKLLPHIAHFFLAASAFCDSKAVVLDPFAGTGTVALETILSKRQAIYAEVNPLARLIIKTKTSFIDQGGLEQSYEKIRQRVDKNYTSSRPDVVNYDLWYDAETFAILSKIKDVVSEETDPILRDLLRITFSVVARKSSRADPRFSVPVRRRVVPGMCVSKAQGRYDADSIWKLFDAQILSNIKRHNEFRLLGCETTSNVRCGGNDARSLQLPVADSKEDFLTRSSMLSESIDLIITSPPYASAQKYVRATSLSLGWLDLAPSNSLSEIEQRTIGREHIRKATITPDLLSVNNSYAAFFIKEVNKINPRRAEITAVYMREMSSAVIEMARVLKVGGRAVIIVGDNTVSGIRFQSSTFVIDLFLMNGFVQELHLVDRIPSRGLMTKRNGNASVISEESILLFRKAC